MPAPRHVRITYSGIFGTVAAPVEDWSFGISLGLPSANFVPTKQNLDDLALALSGTPWTAISTSIATAARLTQVTTALVGDQGRYERDSGGAYLAGEWNGDKAGAGGALALPFQCSLAVTLESTLNHPSGRGRFYIPAPNVGSLGTDGRMGTTSQTSRLNDAKAFVEAVDTAAAVLPWGSVVIASGGSAANAIPAALRQIVAIRVGRRIDTQRRRAEDLPEEYARTAVAT